MIAVDTNILVYSLREDSDFHQAALAALRNLAESDTRWAIPWPCVYETISIATHPRIYRPPTPLGTTLQALEVWLRSGNCELLSEGPGYWPLLEKCVRKTGVQGPLIHDARIAALCAHHNVDVLWTADRDFSRFPELKTWNPLRSGDS